MFMPTLRCECAQPASDRLMRKWCICDLIKQNESELANTVFKIQPNKTCSFFCFLLFVQSFNCLYLWNQLTNLCGDFSKLKPKQYPNRKCKKKKTKIIFFNFRLVLLHGITYVISVHIFFSKISHG